MNTPFTKESLDNFIATPRACALNAVRETRGDILVLGAAGKMGFHLCLMLKRCLEENGQEGRVIAVSRFSSSDSRKQFEACGIDTFPCDLSKESELAALPDAENIWFMAGVKFGTSDNPALLYKMNVKMPELVAKRFRRARVVALSTGCVYSFVPSDSSGASETDPTESPGEYAASCRGREEAFRHASENEGLRAILIRLNYSVEMRYGILVDIARKVLDEQPIDVSMGWFNCIWQGDATAHIIASLALAKSPIEILNVTGPETLSIRETAERFGNLFGKKPIFTGEEQDTAWLNDASKAIQLFGKPEVAPDQMIGWIAEWIKNDGELFGKPTKFEVRSGNF